MSGVNPRVLKEAASAGSGGPAVESPSTEFGQSRKRSWAMAPPLVVGGITRLQRTSRVTAPSSGVTVARTKSGPSVNSGFDREARKT